MIEALSLRKLPDPSKIPFPRGPPAPINVHIMASFRTMTIFCIISMALCCFFGLMGYGGGLMIDMTPPMEWPDEERGSDFSQSCEQGGILRCKSRKRRKYRGPPLQHIPPIPTPSTDTAVDIRSSETAIGTRVLYCTGSCRHCQFEHGTLFIKQAPSSNSQQIHTQTRCSACQRPRRHSKYKPQKARPGRMGSREIPSIP